MNIQDLELQWDQTAADAAQAPRPQELEQEDLEIAAGLTIRSGLKAALGVGDCKTTPCPTEKGCAAGFWCTLNGAGCCK